MKKVETEHPSSLSRVSTTGEGDLKDYSTVQYPYSEVHTPIHTYTHRTVKVGANSIDHDSVVAREEFFFFFLFNVLSSISASTRMTPQG